MVSYENRFTSIPSKPSICETVEVNTHIHEMVEVNKPIHEFENTQENNDETNEPLRRSKRMRIEKSSRSYFFHLFDLRIKECC